MCNILFLGGAKRVSMARFFKKAAKELGMECEIFSYELEKHVPIAIEAKIIIGKKWKDADIFQHLTEVIRKYEISIVIPFVDGAVEIASILSQSNDVRVFAPTSSANRCREMFDKVEAAKIFEELSIPVPATYKGGAPKLPLIAKPRYGSASKGIAIIDTEEKLSRYSAISDYLIQQFIERAEEYTVDCYVGVNTGEPLAIVPRKRIEVSGGEVVRTETVISPQVYDLAASALKKLDLRGAVTIQVLHDLGSDSYLLMEINPRLGGGAVCAVLSGADLPALILRDAMGLPNKYLCYRPYTEIARYSQEVVFFN